MSSIEMIIEPRKKEIGEFTVARVLPYARQRHVGPFVFLDHMGPIEVANKHNVDVRPHPHIGLATVTYLFEGSMIHRDTLGSVQEIQPGDLNWMTAGKGIAHSERFPDSMKVPGRQLHGLQIWVALPKEHEETAPTFFHHPSQTLPHFFLNEVYIKVLLGEVFGQKSPVQTLSKMFYFEALIPAGKTLTFDPGAQELGIYLIEGEAEINGQNIGPHLMPVLEFGAALTAKAIAPTRCIVLGGIPHPEPREIWWNFVSSSKERIQQAKHDWREGRFGQIPGESEFIPLPEN